MILDRTAEDIGRALRPGQLICLESTTYPGTTAELLKPILEAGEYKVGRDVFLAFSPEREDPGNANFGTATRTSFQGILMRRHCCWMPRSRSRALAKATWETAGPRTIIGLAAASSPAAVTAQASRRPVRQRPARCRAGVLRDVRLSPTFAVLTITVILIVMISVWLGR